MAFQPHQQSSTRKPQSRSANFFWSCYRNDDGQTINVCKSRLTVSGESVGLIIIISETRPIFPQQLRKPLSTLKSRLCDRIDLRQFLCARSISSARKATLIGYRERQRPVALRGVRSERTRSLPLTVSNWCVSQCCLLCFRWRLQPFTDFQQRSILCRYANCLSNHYGSALAL